MHDQKLKDITAEICQGDINDWATKLVDYRTIINYADKSFQKAIRFKYIKDNPFGYVMCLKNTACKKGGTTALGKKELLGGKRAAQVFKSYLFGNTQQYTLFYLLAYAGLRRQEILALQWQDIDFNKNKLFIRRAIIYGSQYSGQTQYN